MTVETIVDVVVVTTQDAVIEIVAPARAALIEIIAPPIHMVEVEELGGPVGPPGPQGIPGPPGIGITMKGHVPTYADLPPVPEINDGWVTQDTSHLWVWNGTDWVDCGLLTGPQGPKGEVGDQIMFIGATPPPTPLPGHTWWDSTSGNMFVWYDDGNSAQWVPAHVGTISGDGGGGSGGPVNWNDIQGKPASFPPLLPIAQAGITNLVADQSAQNAAIALKADKSYVDSQDAIHTTAINSKAAVSYVDAQNQAQNDAIALKADITYVDNQDSMLSGATAGKVAKSGDTMTGPLVLPGDPTGNLEAAPKQYVDKRVAKAGDTMTGNLTVAPAAGAANIIIQGTASALLTLKKGIGAFANYIAAYNGPTMLSWVMWFGDGTAQAGSNAGSNFRLDRYDDAGAALASPFKIDRSDGIVQMPLGATTATPSAGDNDTSVATTAFVQNASAYASYPANATIVDNDNLSGFDWEAGTNAKVRWTFAVIKSTLKTYFDTLYTTLATVVASANNFSAMQRVQVGHASPMATAIGSQHFELTQLSTGASNLTFHRSGAYAVNLGLDTDNIIKIGGWSMGAVAYKVMTAQNIVVSTAAPSGGSDGDVWYQVI